MTLVTSGGVAEQAGFRDNDRLLEINGDSVEGATHEQVVKMIKDAGSPLMFLLIDEDTYRFYLNRGIRVEVGLATLKYLPHKPRIVHLTRGSEGYGYLLKEDSKERGIHTQTVYGKCVSTHSIHLPDKNLFQTKGY